MNATDTGYSLQASAAPAPAGAPGVVVEVFSRPGCQQCRLTKQVLDQRGIPYRDIDVDRLGPDAADRLRDLGFLQLPVVRAPGMAPWSGFQPGKLQALVDRA